MGLELDLLVNYPKAKRNVLERGLTKTEEDRAVARKFGKEFFDGERKTGYGGFNYHPRFWQPVVPTIVEQYGIKSCNKILDVGCAKGFMLKDMMELIPGIEVAGIDISHYAIDNAISDVKPFLKNACATNLPFDDKSCFA